LSDSQRCVGLRAALQPTQRPNGCASREGGGSEPGIGRSEHCGGGTGSGLLLVATLAMFDGRALRDAIMQKSEEAKADYVAEHLLYEWEMLHHTFARLKKCSDPMDWNAFFVSFVVYGRNLHDFLLNLPKGKDQRFVARDFTDGYSTPDPGEISRVLGTLHAEVLHLGKRMRDPAGKAGIEAAGQLFQWIEKHWPIFLSTMKPAYRGQWDTAVALYRSAGSADRYRYLVGGSRGPTPQWTSVPSVSVVYSSSLKE
jgi:hypothetical protein